MRESIHPFLLCEALTKYSEVLRNFMSAVTYYALLINNNNSGDPLYSKKLCDLAPFVYSNGIVNSIFFYETFNFFR